MLLAKALALLAYLRGARARRGAGLRAAAARAAARPGAARPAGACSCSRDIGIAAIGTLVAALAVQTRARDLLGPLLALPLLVPVVIGARARELAAAGARPRGGGRAGALAGDARAL